MSARTRIPVAAFPASADAKTSAALRLAPSGVKTRTRNACGTMPGPLESGGDCPGATEFCRDCYAVRAASGYRPAVPVALRRNSETLRAALEDGTAALMLAAMLEEHARQAERAGVAGEPFRFSWSGDILDNRHALAIRDAVRTEARRIGWIPGARPIAWTYTRTFPGSGSNLGPDAADAVRILAPEARAGRLALYVSADPFNATAARRAVARRPWVRVAACARTREEAAEVLRVVRPASAGLPCPENRGTLPLAVAASGRARLADGAPGDDGRGACIACGACPAATRDVLFWTLH